jgi:hypothetical protein
VRVDRSKFVSFALAISATTATVVGCASPDGGEDLGDQTADAVTGGTCTATSIRKPGEGSMKPFAYQEGFCFDLAVSTGAPDAEGVTYKFFDFVHEHCRMYSAQLQPAVAKKVQECLQKSDTRRRNADGEATEEFDAMAMYNCGKNALNSICNDGIDQRVKGRCDRVVGNLEDGETPLAVRNKLNNQCMRIMSGLKVSARDQMEKCTQQGFDLDSCIEGLEEDFGRAQNVADVEGQAQEPLPAPANECVSQLYGSPYTTAERNEKLAYCKDMSERVAGGGGGTNAAYRKFLEAKCSSYVTKFDRPAADLAIGCLQDASEQPGGTGRVIYSCGTTALKHICRESALDATCKALVDEIGTASKKANAGGRLTRQCRALLPGINDAGVAKIKTCVKEDIAALKTNAANSAGNGGNAQEYKDSFAPYAFYSCVEGLR